jgi:hypothetical protein
VEPEVINVLQPLDLDSYNCLALHPKSHTYPSSQWLLDISDKNMTCYMKLSISPANGSRSVICERGVVVSVGSNTVFGVRKVCIIEI